MHLQNQDSAKIWKNGVTKTSDHIQIKITMPNPSQDAPASSKAPNEDLKDMDVHLQNQGREPKFVSWVFQRPVNISKSRSRCKTPVFFI